MAQRRWTECVHHVKDFPEKKVLSMVAVIGKSIEEKDTTHSTSVKSINSRWRRWFGRPIRAFRWRPVGRAWWRRRLWPPVRCDCSWPSRTTSTPAAAWTPSSRRAPATPSSKSWTSGRPNTRAPSSTFASSTVPRSGSHETTSRLVMMWRYKSITMFRSNNSIVSWEILLNGYRPCLTTIQKLRVTSHHRPNTTLERQGKLHLLIGWLKEDQQPIIS